MIKNIIGLGIGFNPSSVYYVVTHGFNIVIPLDNIKFDTKMTMPALTVEDIRDSDDTLHIGGTGFSRI